MQVMVVKTAQAENAPVSQQGNLPFLGDAAPAAGTVKLRSLAWMRFRWHLNRTHAT